MVVVMKPGCTPEQVEHVAELLREMGLKDHVIVGTDLTVVAAVGDKRALDMFGNKYPLEWIRYRSVFTDGLADGSRTLLRYTPLSF